MDKNPLQKEVYLLNENKQKYAYLNVLRVLATLGIIITHVVSPMDSAFKNTLTEYESYFCIILRNISQLCLPVFAMISGAIFLDPQKEITIEKLFKKYILKITLALFIFGSVYAFIEMFFNASYNFSLNQIYMSIANVFHGKLWSHLWYLYVIIGLYICVPPLKIFVNHSGKNILKYTVIVLFVFSSVRPFMERAFLTNIGFHIAIGSVFPLYFLLGHYIHNYKIALKNRTLLIFMAVYLSCIVLMPLNSNFADIFPGGGEPFWEVSSPLASMAVFAIFCFIRQNNKSNRFFDTLSPMCFGIYLTHPLFINFLYKFMRFTPEKYPLSIVLIGALTITILFSTCFTYFARKLTIARKYIL